jgi:hypothetical protein
LIPDKRFRTGATGHVCFGDGDFSQINVRALFEASLRVDAVTAGQTVRGQVDGLRHNTLLYDRDD